MRRDDCVACGAAFPENGTLATLPRGSRVAFDPDTGRVWRLCPACDAWNLLGREAAGAALPEVRQRFAATPSAGPAGLARAQVGATLTLYRIGGPPERAAAVLAVTEARQEISARSYDAPLVWALAAANLIALVGRFDAFGAWLTPATIAGGAVALAIVAREMQLMRRHRRPMRLFVPALAFAPLQLFATRFLSEWGGMVASFLVIGWALRMMLGARPDQAILRWNDLGDAVTVYQGKRIFRGGEALRTASWRLLEAVPENERTPELVAHAWEQLQRTGGLPGILKLLNGFGYHEAAARLSDVPATLRLELALALREAATDPRQELPHGPGEAAAIAVEAERLAGEQRG